MTALVPRLSPGDTPGDTLGDSLGDSRRNPSGCPSGCPFYPTRPDPTRTTNSPLAIDFQPVRGREIGCGQSKLLTTDRARETKLATTREHQTRQAA